MTLPVTVSSIAIGDLGITLNFCQIVSLLSAKKTKAPFDVTLISLAISDFLLSSLASASNIINHSLPNVAMLKLFRHFTIILFNLLAVSSSLHMWFVAIQGLIAVLYPLKLSTWITKKRSVVTLLLLWLVSSVLSTLLSMDNYTYERIFICSPFFSTTVLIVCYFIINHKMLTRKALTVRGQRTQSMSILVYSSTITVIYIITIFPMTIESIRQPVLLRKIDFITNAHQIFFLQIGLDPCVYFFSQILRRGSCRTWHIFYHCSRSEKASTNKEVGNMKTRRRQGTSL